MYEANSWILISSNFVTGFKHLLSSSLCDWLNWTPEFKHPQLFEEFVNLDPDFCDKGQSLSIADHVLAYIHGMMT